jgi:hypothetical protein
VTEEARGAGEVGDDGQQTHASAAPRASFNIDAKGALEQLRPRAVARAVHARTRRLRGFGSRLLRVCSRFKCPADGSGSNGVELTNAALAAPHACSFALGR